jgi:hypothetical protein
LRRTQLLRIVALWVLCLVAGSVLPDRAKEALGTTAHMVKVNGELQLPTMQFRHRLYHFLSFGSTAFLLILLARTPTERLVWPLATIALALAIEYVQHLIGGGPMEWWDVRDDAYAAAAAWLLGQWPALRQAFLKEG